MNQLTIKEQRSLEISEMLIKIYEMLLPNDKRIEECIEMAKKCKNGVINFEYFSNFLANLMVRINHIFGYKKTDEIFDTEEFITKRNEIWGKYETMLPK